MTVASLRRDTGIVPHQSLPFGETIASNLAYARVGCVHNLATVNLSGGPFRLSNPQA